MSRFVAIVILCQAWLALAQDLGDLGDLGGDALPKEEELGGCPPPPILPNTIRSGNDTTLTSIITYRCIKGMVMKSGDEKRVCQVSLKWSGKDLICTLRPCLPLQDIPHATRDNRNTSVGAVTNFRCSEHFTRASGDTRRVCMNRSTWSGQPLVCKSTSCPALHPINAIRNTTDVYQESVVRLACAKGFRRAAGNTLLVCKANQTWSGDALICKGKTCPKLSARLLTNVKPKLRFVNYKTDASKLGSSSGNGSHLVVVGLRTMSGLWRMAGTTISFKCRNGRYPEGGNVEITCRYDGTWSGRPLMCNPTNLALKKYAFQIHTHLYGGEAALAVDGNPSPAWTDRSCTHTNPYKNEKHPWWAVDLTEKYLIGSVSLTNRGDCCGNRLANFKISVTNQRPMEGLPYRPQPSAVCWSSKDQQQQGQTKKYKCPSPLVGRYVVVSLNNGNEVLTLCEVQVFKLRGLAWLKPASQSSTYQGYTASRATDASSSPNPVADTCSCTKMEDNPWWMVDLKQATKIKQVIISYPTDRPLEYKMFNFTISVTNKPPGPSFMPASTEVCLFQADPMNPGELKQFRCEKTMIGRYVVVSMKGRSMLSLCDVTVLG